MNNRIFISRCEIVLTTMHSGSFSQVTAKQIAGWIDVNETSIAPIIAKLIYFNILKKVGAASKTCYQLTDACHNALEHQLRSKDITNSVKYVVNWFISHPQVKASEVITKDGKKFTKVHSSEELDEASNNAINQLMTLINQNKTLKAEVEGLKEEIERLKPYEEYYKKITSVKV